MYWTDCRGRWRHCRKSMWHLGVLKVLLVSSTNASPMRPSHPSTQRRPNQLHAARNEKVSLIGYRIVEKPLNIGAIGKGRLWTSLEEEYLRDWFEQHQSLSPEEIENQYQFSGQGRSYLALQAKLYEQGLGHLCNKKRKSSPGYHVASKPPLTSALTPSDTPTPSDTRPSIDPAQLSLAVSLISGSSSPRPRSLLCTPILEEEAVEVRPSLPDWQRSGPRLSSADDKAWPALDNDEANLNVPRLDSCKPSQVPRDIRDSTSETSNRSKASHANEASPIRLQTPSTEEIGRPEAVQRHSGLQNASQG